MERDVTLSWGQSPSFGLHGMEKKNISDFLKSANPLLVRTAGRHPDCWFDAAMHQHETRGGVSAGCTPRTLAPTELPKARRSGAGSGAWSGLGSDGVAINIRPSLNGAPASPASQLGHSVTYGIGTCWTHISSRDWHHPSSSLPFCHWSE